MSYLNNSTWPMGGGSSPRAFGQFLNSVQLPSGATRDNNGGYAPGNISCN